MLKKTAHTLWMLLVLSLVLVALALTAARVWIPQASVYRAELERAASDMLGKQVTVQHMRASWRGVNPVIRLKQVEVAATDGSHSPLRAREVRITVDAEHYLSSQEVRLAGIDVVGADLTLLHDADGSFYIEGFRPDEDSTLLQELLQMALTLHDVNVTYIDRGRDAAPQRFSSINLSLRSHDDIHTVTGYALLPPEIGYRADIEALLQGEPGRVQDWEGSIYLRGESIALSAVMQRLLTDDQVIEGVADLRLWLNIADRGIASVSGELDTTALNISQQGESQTYTFSADALQGQFGWRTREDGWQFAVQNVRVTQQQGQWNSPNLSLAGRPYQDGYSIAGVSPLVVLEGFGALLPIIPGLDVEQRSMLGGLKPAGTIKDLEFAISNTPEATRVEQFAARFTGLSVEQSGVLPKLAGLDGVIFGHSASGTLALSSYNMQATDDRLFGELMQIDRAIGEVSWLMDDEQFELQTRGFRLENSDLSLDIDAGLLLPLAGDAPVVNLAVNVDRFDVGRTHVYLPEQVMPARGVSWLDRSLAGGMVTDGRVVLNGPVDRIPFDDGDGILEVQLPVSDARLDYHADWSPVTDLDAIVLFSGRRMDIHSTRGKIRSAELEGVHAQILDIATPDLTITGDVRGALPVMLAELDSSPLGDTWGGFVENVATKGSASLGLDIGVPLSKPDAPVTVGGRIGLRGNTLRVKDTDVELTAIKGRLVFDDDGIDGKDLRANLFGHPGRAGVSTDRESGTTRIVLDGPFDLFNRYIEKDSMLGAATTGESDWRVEVAIRGKPERGKRTDIGVIVSSDLAGTHIDLPAPLGKTAADARPLRVEAARLEVGEQALAVNYQSGLVGELVIAPEGDAYVPRRGGFTFGGDAHALPGTDKLVFTGNLERFSLSEWQPHFRTGEGAGLPLEFDLDIATTEILGYPLGRVEVEMKSVSTGWEIEVGGAQLSGEIDLVNNAQGIDRLTAKLKHLVLDNAQRETLPASASEQLTPDSFPDLEVLVKSLTIDDTAFGLLEISADKQGEGVYMIERAVLSSELLAARLSGNWREDRDGQISSVDFEISDGRMDELMAFFGYQQNIERGTLTADMRLAWPGPPWVFVPAIAEGKVKLRVTSGQLLDVSPGAAGRVLGLISLNNLPRRLSLDFSDLFEEGFSFDEIDGSFVLDDGNAYTNDLFVNGPPARIEISGRIGIAEQDYDELVTVTPYVKTGLPLAGTLAGGPAVGAVLLVAETLLEDQLGPLNRIAMKQYSVTGPWSDPVIEKISTSPEVDETEGVLELD